MQGASPLASPVLNPGGTGFSCGKRVPAGGLLGWLPADLAVPESAGVACLLCRLPTLPLACFLAPIPPTPLPGGKGEIKSLFRRGLPPPAPLQSGGKRHWICFWETVLLAFRGKFSTAGKEIQAAQVFPMPHGYKPDSKPTAEAAKPILQNPKSQPPSDTARKPQVRAPT